MLYGKKIIALCIANAGDNRNYEFIHAMNHQLQKNGYKLFIYHTCTDFYNQKQCEEGEKAVFELMDYSIIDAVVVFCESFKDDALVDQLIATANRNKTPVISVGEVRQNAVPLMFDYESGFEEILRHVVEEHGIHHTCMVAGFQGEYHSENRINIYKKVLQENGLPFSDGQLYYGDYWWGPTKQAVQRMIVEETVPQAIICANDSMAIAVCEELKKHGYTVPEQVMVTGFDGTLEAQVHKPAITTAKCDMNLAAKEIVNILEQIEKQQPLKELYEVPYVRAIYRSCGCQRRAHHGINIGERLKWAEDRFYKYQDDERTLMEVSEMILGCDSPKQFAKCLKVFNFYNICVALNEDCLDETINPAAFERSTPFDDRMQVIYRTEVEGALFPEPMPLSAILPDLEARMQQEDPILFNALNYLGKPFGYLYFGSFSLEEYSKILQYVKTLSNAFGTYRVIKNLKYTAASIEEMSRLDHLTGILNRTGFYAALPELMEKAGGKYIMTAALDVDNLKKTNDQYGHAAGDDIIKKIAQAMEHVPFEDKLCGRFGGDEMVMCVVADTVAEEGLLKDRIERYLDDMNRKEEKPYAAEASIGIVTMKADAFDITTALKRSDQIMYENKARKKAGRS